MQVQVFLARSILVSLFGCISVASASAEPNLTIYNGNFALVQDQIPLSLGKGVNEFEYTDATLLLEPDSVILRDQQGRAITILEQSYRNDSLSQELLLSIFEGETIEFLVNDPDKGEHVIEGRIIRAQSRSPQAAGSYPYNPYPQNQLNVPVIEVDGRVRFGLPGQPLFPSLGDNTILKPRLSWKIDSARNADLEADLSYLTGGLSWSASYNIVDSGDGIIDLSGWITMENLSGKTFNEAQIKLMAGEVNKVVSGNGYLSEMDAFARTRNESLHGQRPSVTQRDFDEYHLYELANSTTLKDQETKQVEFLHVADIRSTTRYVYDGQTVDWNNYNHQNIDYRRTNSAFGIESYSEVDVVREIGNTEENGLGLPLPAGIVRFYQQDELSREFIGEDLISHTPSDETLKLRTGSAFDLVGERVRTDFEYNHDARTVKETFEVTLRNRKKQDVEIQVLEHMLRWTNWELIEADFDHNKLDSDTIEFNVPLEPGEEKAVHYSVLYSW